MDIDTFYKKKINNNTNNKINNKTNNNTNNKTNKLNLNKQKNKTDIVFMDIDVEKGMCQGIFFSKSNIALKCNKTVKYCKNNKFMVCEKHKHQIFGY
mgnify:CR=1 FL=1